MHEELVRLLEEWKKYKAEADKNETRHIAEKELGSIGIEIEKQFFKMIEAKCTDEITKEERKIIEGAFKFLITEVI